MTNHKYLVTDKTHNDVLCSQAKNLISQCINRLRHMCCRSKNRLAAQTAGPNHLNSSPFSPLAEGHRHTRIAHKAWFAGGQARPALAVDTVDPVEGIWRGPQGLGGTAAGVSVAHSHWG
jgi:hypothetical protein